MADRKDQIKVFYLPPYSPEINPDEYLNRDFKTVLRISDQAPSKKALLQKATTFWNSSAKCRSVSWHISNMRRFNMLLSLLFDCRVNIAVQKPAQHVGDFMQNVSCKLYRRRKN
jgi:DDE superfamily endonuclease